MVSKWVDEKQKQGVVTHLWQDLSAGRRIVSTGGGLVDVVLEDGIGHGADGGEGKTKRHLADGAPLDSLLAEEGIEHMVDEGCDDDNSNGVEVVEEIVGDAVSLHAGSEGVGGSTKGAVVDVEDGEEAEDSGRLECATNIVDEGVIVRVCLGAAGSDANAGLGGVPESLAADGLDATVRKSLAENLEHVAKIGTSGRLLDQAGVQVPQQGREQQVDDGGDEIGGPVADKSGQVGGGDTSGGTDVDQEVEPQHDAVDRVLGVDNHSLAVLIGNDVGDLVGALVHDGGGDIGLELGWFEFKLAKLSRQNTLFASTYQHRSPACTVTERKARWRFRTAERRAEPR